MVSSQLVLATHRIIPNFKEESGQQPVFVQLTLQQFLTTNTCAETTQSAASCWDFFFSFASSGFLSKPRGQTKSNFYEKSSKVRSCTKEGKGNKNKSASHRCLKDRSLLPRTFLHHQTLLTAHLFFGRYTVIRACLSQSRTSQRKCWKAMHAKTLETRAEGCSSSMSLSFRNNLMQTWYPCLWTLTRG